MATPSGVVTLCKNALVPRDYSHTIDFKDPSEQLAYWGLLKKYQIEKVPYIRKQRAYIVVPYSLDDLVDVNYMYFYCKEDSKIYYAFVTDKEYSQEKQSFIYFDIDVMQSYMFDYTVRPSYILQEHVDRWTADHQPIYSKTDEGLNYGDEYVVESAYRIKETALEEEIRWYLVVMKNPKELRIDGGTPEPIAIHGYNTPYLYYLVPESKENVFQFRYNASLSEPAEDGIGDMYDLTDLMLNSTIGDFIVQIARLNYLPFNFKYGKDTGVIVVDSVDEEDVWFTTSRLGTETKSVSFIQIIEIFNNYNFMQNLAEMGVFEGIESAMPTKEQWTEIKAKPYEIDRDRRFESKLLCYPYRYNLLTDHKNQPILVKNEYIGGDKIKVNYTQAISFNSPARYWLENYLKDPEGRDNSLVNLVPEEQPITSDVYYNYMLQNKNQIQANVSNAVINAGTNILQGALTGAVFTPPTGVGGLGAAALGAGALLEGVVNVSNMIRSENAKQKDLKNMPNTIINSNDCLFNNVDKNHYIDFYRYKICCEFEEQLADTFNMYGYTIKRVKTPSTKSRVRFNYVKTIGANVVGSFNQNDLAMIRAIYDAGITFWHYNTTNFKMFDYSLENIERSLL